MLKFWLWVETIVLYEDFSIFLNLATLPPLGPPERTRVSFICLGLNKGTVPEVLPAEEKDLTAPLTHEHSHHLRRGVSCFQLSCAVTGQLVQNFRADSFTGVILAAQK